MTDDMGDRRRVIGWALPASLAVHLLMVALLIFGLPVSLSQPQKEQAIKVDLVPPPKPAEKKAEPPPPKEEAESEKSQEAKVEQPQTTKDDVARHAPFPILKPVFQFGEKDAGPRQATDGNDAEDGSTTPTAEPAPDRQDAAEPVVTDDDEQKDSAASATEPHSDQQDLAAPPVVTAPGAAGQVAQPQSPEPTAAKTAAPKTAARKATDVAKPRKPSKLQQARRLFSRAATGDPVATTLMAGVPPDVRAIRLCVTELREQLLHAAPPYFPDLLPSDRPKGGTVIDVPGTAFRAFGQWFDLSYRCEVDKDATRVVSFAFQVGNPVPRSEWARRKLPSQ